MGDLINFLRGRGVPEDQINKLESEKIDHEVLLLMEDGDLKRYIPSYGDRVAAYAYCKSLTARLDNESPTTSEDTLSQPSLLERLKGKAPCRKRRQSVFQNLDSTSKDPRSTNAIKQTRRIELGWLNFDNLKNDYRQVRSQNGGGMRHLTIDKHFAAAEILAVGTELFFPEGKSKLGKIDSFSFCVKNFQLQDLHDNTVADLYNKTKFKMLRLYICTKATHVEPMTMEYEQQNISPSSLLNVSNPNKNDTSSDSDLPTLVHVVPRTPRVNTSSQSAVHTLVDAIPGPSHVNDTSSQSAVRTLVDTIPGPSHVNTSSQSAVSTLVDAIPGPSHVNTSSQSAVPTLVVAIPGPSHVNTSSQSAVPTLVDAIPEPSHVNDASSESLLSPLVDMSPGPSHVLGQPNIDTGTPTIAFNQRLNLRRNIVQEMETMENLDNDAHDLVSDDDDANDHDLQRALHASISSETSTFETLLQNWMRTNILDAGNVEIIIHRRRIIESTKRAMRRVGFTCVRPLYVHFAGEIGEDYGGPRREYFRLLMTSIKDKLLEGPPCHMTFRHVLQNLENKDYFMAGKCVAWSLLHGGPGLPCLNTKLYYYIAEDSNINLCIDDVHDGEIKAMIMKIRDDEDLTEVWEWAIDQGLPPLVQLTPERRNIIVQLAVKNNVYYRISAEIAQFREGLNDVGNFGDVVKNNAEKMKRLFTSNTPLTVDKLKSNLTINFSEAGSNNRILEEDTVYCLELFLQDCADESVAIGLCDILSFWTGSEDIPPLGFPKKMELDFVDNKEQLPVAHTCSMSLQIPRGIDDPDEFKRKMTMAIQWSGGFHVA